MEQLYDQIHTLLQSNDVAENLLALRAIDALIDVPFGEGASKVSKFASFLRIVFDVKRDPEILVPASTVLGHLAKAGGAMTADEVEQQVSYKQFWFAWTENYCFHFADKLSFSKIKTALGWLGGDRVEYRRFAAVLILKVSCSDPPFILMCILSMCLLYEGKKNATSVSPMPFFFY